MVVRVFLLACLVLRKSHEDPVSNSHVYNFCSLIVLLLVATLSCFDTLDSQFTGRGERQHQLLYVVSKVNAFCRLGRGSLRRRLASGPNQREGMIASPSLTRGVCSDTSTEHLVGSDPIVVQFLGLTSYYRRFVKKQYQSSQQSRRAPDESVPSNITCLILRNLDL